MSINIRTKGQNGEREAGTILGRMLGVGSLARNLEQVRSGGADLLDISGLCIEVKRHETLAVNTWWRQVSIAADKRGDIPVLMYRQNRKPWHFCIPAYLLLPNMRGYLTLDEGQFETWLRVWTDDSV
jgi:hypothetical protein